MPQTCSEALSLSSQRLVFVKGVFMPTQVPLKIYCGDDHHWTFHLFLDEANTLPYNFPVGTVAKAEIRVKSGQPVLATLDCDVTPPNVVDADLDSAQSGQLSGKASWDLQLTFPGTPPRVKTPLGGPVTITADITDSDH